MKNDKEKNYPLLFLNKSFFPPLNQQNLAKEIKKYKLIKFSFILIVIFQIIILAYFYFYFNFFQNANFNILNIDQAVYVISIVNSPDWIRSTNLWNKWGRKFTMKYPYNLFKFVSFKPNPNFSKVFLFAETPIKNYRGFFYLFNAAVEDFLKNTKFQWIYRTTEDCLVDVDVFGEYMKNLSSQYISSLPVMKGHAVAFSANLFFVHGGSGWIMSRKAAQIYYDKLHELSVKYNSDPMSGDDVLIGWFAKNFLNLTFADIDDPYFLGSPYQDEEVQIVYEKNWTALPNCTVSKVHIQRPIKEIIFWHSGRRDNYPMNIGIKAKDVYPPNVYYDQYSNPRRLCIYRH